MFPVNPRVYRQTVIPGKISFISTFLYGCAVVAIAAFSGVSFFMVLFTALVLVRWVLYGCFIIEIDDEAIAFGFKFTGRERVPFEAIQYAEILHFASKDPDVRSILKGATPPAMLATSG